MNKIYQIKGSLLFKNPVRAILVCLLVTSMAFSAQAQCPPNIDFEQGDFTGWKCYIGTFNNGALNLNVSPPTANRHEIIPASNTLRDPYGNFPQHCPNGSNYSVKLGNNTGGGQAESVSYTFTIPPTQNEFSLIYNYAMVLNDGGHPTSIQPRLTIDVKNVTDNTTDPCSSFDIAIGVGGLPGFVESSTPDVWYKDWSANTINLDGNAGKTIQITFTTTDCGATAHFGYAYIDVNAECTSSFIGAVFCPDDNFINVTAPYGYAGYRWWDVTDPSTILATTQTINFTPPPPAGTILNVELTPYLGYGCVNILAAKLMDTLTIQSQAGPDKLSCQNAPVQLGTTPKATYVYSWDPPTYLSNPNIANPIATPSATGTMEYVVTTSHEGGGCVSTDTVIVKAAVLDAAVNVTGPLTGCITAANPTVLNVNAADSIQWYRNTFPIPGANGTSYNVIQTGTYHATVFSFLGCNLTSSDIIITANPQPVVGFKPNTPQDQCFNGHQFTFTDTSSIAFGTLTYTWDMGDQTTPLNTTNVNNYKYALPGTYKIKQLVVSLQGCSDSAFYTVHVFDSPVAAFDADIKGTCFKNNSFTFTNSSTLAVGTLKYLWSFGDTNTDTSFNVTHSYLQPGTYNVRLTTTSDKGCPNDSAFDVTVHPEPFVDIKNPDPQQCFGNNLFTFPNNSYVLTGSLSYNWYFGDGTGPVPGTNPTHNYTVPGEYTVKMVALSDKGCTDSTTTAVKIFKYAIADFIVDPICINTRLPLFNRTINTSPSVSTFLWDFGNGDISTVQSPEYRYPKPGNYTIQLSVSNIQCPQTVSVKTLNVSVDEPAPATRYADVEAVMNFGEQLQARQIANTVLWKPAINLDFANSYRPKFKGLASQLYYVQLKTKTGCLTVDTQYVKIKKKIQIYVPTSFTPDGNGKNDYLYPTLMGFKQLNYFRIYDRWGKMLFQSETERPGWDGKVNGNPMAIQTVVWMVEAVDVDGVAHKQQGTTILIR